jgi:hypothetical protein
VRLVDGNLKLSPFVIGDTEGELDRVVPITIFVEEERLKSKHGGNEQQTFLHFKAFEHLKAYVKWLRNQSVPITTTTPLFMSIRKPHNRVGGDVFNRVVKDATTDAFANGKDFSTHDFRRFHQTALEQSGMPEPWINRLQGRKLGRVRRAYSQPIVKNLHSKYKDAIAYLVPPDEPPPQQALAQRISQQEETIKQQRQWMREFLGITLSSLQKFTYKTEEEYQQFIRVNQKKPIEQLRKEIIETMREHAIARTKTILDWERKQAEQQNNQE